MTHVYVDRSNHDLTVWWQAIDLAFVLKPEFVSLDETNQPMDDK